MVLLGLKEQREIVAVIEYLLETHLKNNTVADVMKRFGITMEQYWMCSNFAKPAIAQGNIKGSYTAVKNANRNMRSDIATLYELVKDDTESVAAAGVRKLYQDWCEHKPSAVYGKNEDDEIQDDAGKDADRV